MAQPTGMSRRGFALAGASLAALKGAAPPTAAELIDRIKKNVGVPWRTQTVDNVIAGDPNTAVKGVAVTMMATLDLLQRAAAAGRNFVITHEPTFYSHQDRTDNLVNNAMYQFKQDFIKKNGMVVFHFHDHWHGRKPDGILVGMAQQLGWEKNADPEKPRCYNFPGPTLEAFVRDVKKRTGARAVRVVGDPKMPVKRVATSWGYSGLEGGLYILSSPDVDVFICGETREWELVEYAQDLVASGQKKALVVVGHVPSEEAGMKYCAGWLKGFISEVPVEFIEAGEPFWTA